MTTAQKDAEF